MTGVSAAASANAFSAPRNDQAGLRRCCLQRSCPQASPATAMIQVAGSGTGTGAVARNPERFGMLHENWNTPVESNLEINALELSVPLLT